MNRHSSFVVTGKVNDLSLRICEENVDFKNGVWALKIDTVLIECNSECNLNFNCVLTCSGVTSKFYGKFQANNPSAEYHILEECTPLCVFNAKQIEQNHFSKNFSENWFYVNKPCDGNLKFFIRDVDNPRIDPPIPHNVTVFVIIKRLQ